MPLPLFAAIMGGQALGSLTSGGLGYLGSQSAARSQQQAAQTSGLYGMIAQHQALQQARELAEKGAAAAGEYYGKGRSDVLGQAGLGEAAGREFYGQGVGFQQPYMQAGAGATNQLASLYAPGGAYTRQPTLEELQMDPGYKFRYEQGLRALQSNLGASGMRGSGRALTSAIDYGQEAGSQEYQNAYARFMANRAQAAQGLQNLAGTGAGAAQVASGLAGQTGTNLMANRFTTGSNLGTLASNAGGTVSGAYTGAMPTIAGLAGANPMGAAAENIGQARASGYMGGASALGQALQGASNAPMNALLASSLYDRMSPPKSGMSYGPQQGYNPQGTFFGNLFGY